MKYPYKQIDVNGRHMEEHRYIMEQHLGRKLGRNEYVHHINGNKMDNRIENLMVMSPQEHNRLHKTKYPEKKVCLYCRREFVVPIKHRGRNKFCCLKCATKYGAMSRKKTIVATDKEGNETIYDSLKNAAKLLGKPDGSPNILKCLKGETHSAYGFKWRYK